MLLIERSEGVETKPIKTSYSPAAGTAFVIFENVKVPVENLLGKEGGGFQVIMFNFNHERWAINCAVISNTRLVLEECFKWANQREVFGKKLLEQPVIRNKLAHMVRLFIFCARNFRPFVCTISHLSLLPLLQPRSHKSNP